MGLLPVPHPILIRKYQANSKYIFFFWNQIYLYTYILKNFIGGTTAWFRTYMWGIIYLRNVDPAIWYETEVKLFEIQRV